ncbi:MULTISPECIES: hypothetical protein [spotted fever group]|uniref:Uncharacterized protein n=1 Tax=Rickettsia philipii (strain 364D) TaxID=481009 RepID=H6PU76_RICP3|nr:hypothetical protein [Rickettsia philipii]AFB26423.1 hypothetical protein RSA_04375 [Rickettsia philipii str. 364D]
MKIFNSYRDSIFIKDHVKSKHIIDKEKEQLRYEILEKEHIWLLDKALEARFKSK